MESSLLASSDQDVAVEPLRPLVELDSGVRCGQGTGIGVDFDIGSRGDGLAGLLKVSEWPLCTLVGSRPPIITFFEGMLTSRFCSSVVVGSVGWKPGVSSSISVSLPDRRRDGGRGLPPTSIRTGVLCHGYHDDGEEECRQPDDTGERNSKALGGECGS